MTMLPRLCLTCLIASACADDHQGDRAPDVAEQKAAVRASLEDDVPGNDLACEESWKDDGTCDDFCPGGDTLDCEVTCAAVQPRRRRV